MKAWKGTARDRVKRAKARQAVVTNYCQRHGLPLPTTAAEVARIDGLVFAETMAAWRQRLKRRSHE